MTDPTIAVPNFQRDQILTAAIRLTGILPYGKQPSADQIAATAVHLNLTLDELQSDNIVRRQVERTTLALTSSVATYDLGADIMDIEMGSGDVAGTVYSAANTAESIVTSISIGDFGKLTSKSTAGRPSRVLVEHLATPKLTFWPIPDGDMTFRYVKVRWLFQSATGATTLDLRRSWLSYITYAVAIGVCMENSLFEKAQFFVGLAAQKKALAQAGDVERGNIRFRVGHSGRNWA
jgi:hypothetical protein